MQQVIKNKAALLGTLVLAAVLGLVLTYAQLTSARISNPPPQGVSASSANTFTALQQFGAGASTTALSVYNNAWFGATATSSFDSTGALTLATDLSVANGGTGASTLTGILQGNGTSAFTAITGVIGQLLYFNGTNTGLATSSIFIDTNERVGIGSTTPQRDLSVDGSIAGQECALTDGATVTFNLRSCNQARVTLGGNRTLDITNETEAIGQTIRLVVCQDGTGSRTLTWDAAILWPGGTAPTLTTTANKCDVLAGFTTLATSTAKVFLGSTLNF